MNFEKNTYFSFLRHAFGTNTEAIDLSVLARQDWQVLVDMSFNQGVAAIMVDGLGLMVRDCPNLELEIDKPELEDLKYEWFEACFENEQSYEEHLKAIDKLATLYNNQSIKMLLLKGYGLSLNYPVPNHRPSGDIDVYLYQYGSFGDQMVQKFLGCKVKQNEDKHSVFQVDGISVENHARFVDDSIHPSLCGLNDFFVAEAQKAVEHQVGSAHILLPSVMFNALFVPFHCACHFFRGEANVRQLCDWACFVKRYGAEVDWDRVRELAEKYGFLKFYRCLNGIVQEYLGVPANCLPDWTREKKLEIRILQDILAPRKEYPTLISKVYRFFS